LQDIPTIIGTLAALCTTLSYIPQVRKCWSTRETHDLSFKMLIILAAGLALWTAYGFLRRDVVIITANSVSVALVASLLYLKMREKS
jgi:MtN3 and saliva related transmembrane protein